MAESPRRTKSLATTVELRTYLERKTPLPSTCSTPVCGRAVGSGQQREAPFDTCRGGGWSARRGSPGQVCSRAARIPPLPRRRRRHRDVSTSLHRSALRTAACMSPPRAQSSRSPAARAARARPRCPQLARLRGVPSRVRRVRDACEVTYASRYPSGGPSRRGWARARRWRCPRGGSRRGAATRNDPTVRRSDYGAAPAIVPRKLRRRSSYHSLQQLEVPPLATPAIPPSPSAAPVGVGSGARRSTRAASS